MSCVALLATAFTVILIIGLQVFMFVIDLLVKFVKIQAKYRCIYVSCQVLC